jgi:hypothetical protein
MPFAFETTELFRATFPLSCGGRAMPRRPFRTPRPRVMCSIDYLDLSTAELESGRAGMLHLLVDG